MNRRKELVDLIWQKVKVDNQKAKTVFPKAYSEIKVTKKEVDNSVFYREGEHRISGERDNNFSLFYVNYYDNNDLAYDLMDYLRKHGWDSDWYSPAYIITSKNPSGKVREINDYHFVNDRTGKHVKVVLKELVGSSDEENEYWAYDLLADKIKDKTLSRDNPKSWYLDDVTRH